MTRKIVLLSCMMICFVYANTQQLRFDINPLDRNKKPGVGVNYQIKHLGILGDVVLYFRSPYLSPGTHPDVGGRNRYWLSAYDNQMNLINQTALEVYYKNKPMMFQDIVLLGDRVIQINYFQNTRHRKFYLFAQPIDPRTLKPDGTMQMIGELDYSGFDRFLRTQMQVQTSEDNSKMMIHFSFIDYENRILRQGMYAYDDQLNRLFSNHNISVTQHDEGVLSYERFKVANNGTVYLLARHYPGTRQIRQERAELIRTARGFREEVYVEKPSYVYHIYRFSEENPDGNYALAELPGMFVRSLSLVPTGTNEVICYGIYSNPGTISAVGAMVYTFNLSSGRISNLSTYSFDSRLETPCFTNDELNTMRGGLGRPGEWDPFRYRLGELQQRENGDHFFVAEQIATGMLFQHKNQPMRVGTFYAYDILVFHTDQEIALESMQRVERRQYWKSTTRYSDVFLTESDGKLHMLYNEMPFRTHYSRRESVGEYRYARLSPSGVHVQTIAKYPASRAPRKIMPGTAAMIRPGVFVYGKTDYAWARDYYEVLSIR